MRAQGIEVPAVGEKKGPRLGTRIRSVVGRCDHVKVE